MRNQNEPALRDALERALATRSVGEWLARLTAADLPCGPINDVAQVMADEQVLARNMVVTVDDPVMGALRLAGNPIKLSGYPDPSTRRPAPELDADRNSVLGPSGPLSGKARAGP